MSAFVDFEDVVAAQRAHDSELVLAGQRLRTDYNHPREPHRNADRDDYRSQRDKEFRGWSRTS
ncbi:hypothetical protein PINS_up017239 [Pythium insidiosum]|nr:hypothetical protein PINS_up017239 [Pythium insidiosum]